MPRIWKPKSIRAGDDMREYWSTGRDVPCSACGDTARHYEAQYSADLNLFTIPYAGLNGGIGREVDANYWGESLKDEQNVYLSECCDAPRFGG